MVQFDHSKFQAEQYYESYLMNVGGDPNKVPKRVRPVRLSDIKFNSDLTAEKFISDWGLPDRVVGFGQDTLIYDIGNGDSLCLVFYREGGGVTLQTMKLKTAGVSRKNGKHEYLYDVFKNKK